MIIPDYSSFKKGDKVKMTWGCYDDYEGIIVKVYKYKILITTTKLNNRPFNETRDFLKEYVRSLEKQDI
jgi:ribosomal protein L24